MMKYLDSIEKPEDLQRLSFDELHQLSGEIRELVIDVVSRNPGHLASNLGIVELTIALHYCYEFDIDRLVWDVGHQCYVHKILTGRKNDFQYLRQYKGLSGFPNKKESVYDPFTTGHSGDAISTALGLACGHKILGRERKIVSVVGDGGMGPGMTFEALNHAGDLKYDILVVLNDNRIAISKTIGAFSKYLNKIRTDPIFTELKREISGLLNVFPVLGKPVEGILEQINEKVRRAISPGQIFVDLGFEYYGPIDGHNIKLLVETLKEIKNVSGPKLLHVITSKGKGFKPASMNPTQYHSAGNFQHSNGDIVVKKKIEKPLTYTDVFGKAILEQAKINDKIVAITAAMPDGTGLVPFCKEFPNRYFDVGICEQHGIGLASGLSTDGLRPVAAIYSTFLQRAYDQVFHDVCLQELNVVFAIDRAGIVGNDGPTHNGVFDIAYLKHLPGMVVMAPKDGAELCEMLKLALNTNAPVAIRYPKDNIPDSNFDINNINFESPVTFGIGEAEIIRQGSEVAIIAYGATVYSAIEAAKKLSNDGVEATVVNARFTKPFDTNMLKNVMSSHQVVITIEDHMLTGGFGSTVLESAPFNLLGQCKIIRLGIPDIFVEAGVRKVLLKNMGLDANGLYSRAMEELGRIVDYKSKLGIVSA